jgi:hypothetical protein
MGFYSFFRVVLCSTTVLAATASVATPPAAPAPLSVAYSQQLLTQQQAHDAIVAMAGSFDVHYSFTELYPLRKGYALKENKISQGRDVVLILEDRPDKISLQHLLIAPNGELMKHWRQDWHYQPLEAWQYLGGYQWQKISYSRAQVKGQWLQTVWNADDSPRYAALGQWQNQAGVLSWRSELTKRPLPRREYRKRQDYDLMLSINQHVLSPEGWVQQEENWKYNSAQQQTLVKENGVIRYQRITIDQTPVQRYWHKHQAYWQQVRQLWQGALAQNAWIALRSPEQAQAQQKPAHYVNFLIQEQALASQTLTPQQLRHAAAELLNQELLVGQVD